MKKAFPNLGYLVLLIALMSPFCCQRGNTDSDEINWMETPLIALRPEAKFLVGWSSLKVITKEYLEPQIVPLVKADGSIIESVKPNAGIVVIGDGCDRIETSHQEGGSLFVRCFQGDKLRIEFGISLAETNAGKVAKFQWP